MSRDCLLFWQFVQGIIVLSYCVHIDGDGSIETGCRCLGEQFGLLNCCVCLESTEEIVRCFHPHFFPLGHKDSHVSTEEIVMVTLWRFWLGGP